MVITEEVYESSGHYIEPAQSEWDAESITGCPIAQLQKAHRHDRVDFDSLLTNTA